MSAAELKLCRFCAEKKCDDVLLDFTIHFNVYKELKKKLSYLKVEDITFSSEDGLSKGICLHCNKSLDAAYEFIVKIRRSQAILRAVSQHSTKNVKLHHNLITDIKNEARFEEEFDYDNPADSDYSDTCETYTKQDISKPIIAPNVKADIWSDDSWTAYQWHCQFCNQIFANINILREHSISDHNLCCALKCADCENKFNSFEEFVDHAREHRNTLRSYCEYCNLKLDAENILKHVWKHKKRQNICEKCCQVFNNRSDLREHTKKYLEINANLIKKRKKLAEVVEKSWKGYTWMCQLCKATFVSITKLRSHAKEMHGKCFVVKCIDCEDVMDSYKGFIIHARYHRRYLKRLCHYCDYGFDKNEKRADHIATHFTESARLCEGCGEILPNSEAYQSHVAMYNPPKPKISLTKLDRPLCVDDITCEICQKVFTGTFYLREHKLLVHSEGDKKFVCEKCGKPFASKSALNTHQLMHEDQKPVVCEICQKRFGTQRDFRQHVSTHTGDKPFECEICQRRFRLKKQLVSHTRMHTDEKPFECQFCEKAFRQRKYLKEHENKHTGARPYSCRDCGKEYASWKSCEKHMRTKHGTKMAQRKDTSLKPVERDVDDIKKWAKQVLAPKRRKKIDHIDGNI